MIDKEKMLMANQKLRRILIVSKVNNYIYSIINLSELTKLNFIGNVLLPSLKVRVFEPQDI